MRQTEREDQETDIRSLIFRTDLKKRGSRLAFLVSLNFQLSTKWTASAAPPTSLL